MTITMIPPAGIGGVVGADGTLYKVGATGYVSVPPAVARALFAEGWQLASTSKSSFTNSGRVTLVAGVAVVPNVNVAAASNIITAIQSLGTVTAPKAHAVTARSVGASFTITSADATDTSIVYWGFD